MQGRKLNTAVSRWKPRPKRPALQLVNGAARIRDPELVISLLGGRQCVPPSLASPRSTILLRCCGTRVLGILVYDLSHPTLLLANAEGAITLLIILSATPIRRLTASSSSTSRHLHSVLGLVPASGSRQSRRRGRILNDEPEDQFVACGWMVAQWGLIGCTPRRGVGQELLEEIEIRALQPREAVSAGHSCQP